MFASILSPCSWYVIPNLAIAGSVFSVPRAEANTPLRSGTCSRSPAASGGWLSAATRPCPFQEGHGSPTLHLSMGTLRTCSDYRVDIRSFDGALPLTGVRAIVSASLENRALGAATTYVDEASGLEVTVEFPVNLINLNEADDEFQICTGPVAVPDLGTWDGEQAHRVFIADVAVSQFDHVEFILRHDVAVAPEERVWMDEPIGRDRLELRDPENPPPGYPPNRPMVKAYHDVIDLPSRNEFWMVDEG